MLVPHSRDGKLRVNLDLSKVDRLYRLYTVDIAGEVDYKEAGGEDENADEEEKYADYLYENADDGQEASDEDADEVLDEEEYSDWDLSLSKLCEEFYMIARMEYKDNKYVFVEMGVNLFMEPKFVNNELNIVDKGYTYFSRNPQLFVETDHKMHKSPLDISHLCSSLREDGYEIEEWWKNVPTLKFLCQMALYKNREMLQYVMFEKELPKTLKTSLKKFIRTRTEIRRLKDLRRDKQ